MKSWTNSSTETLISVAGDSPVSVMNAINLHQSLPTKCLFFCFNVLRVLLLLLLWNAVGFVVLLKRSRLRKLKLLPLPPASVIHRLVLYFSTARNNPLFSFKNNNMHNALCLCEDWSENCILDMETSAIIWVGLPSSSLSLVLYSSLTPSLYNSTRWTLGTWFGRHTQKRNDTPTV